MGYFGSLTEKLSGREVVGLLIGVIAIGCLAYAADQYIYQPCGIPISWHTGGSARFTSLVFIGFSVVAYLLIGRIRWFANHIGWLVAVAIISVLIITALVVRF